jgi:hypothetical protein
MPSATFPRFVFSLSVPLRTRPLDEVNRRRVEALLYAGCDEAAVHAYRQVTHAPQRTALRAVARMKATLDVPA